MTAIHPPRLATMLLRWMGPRDEGLVGDLLEAFSAGRSDWWYWRQVLAAVVIGTATGVWRHKLVAARAIALGWIGVWLYVTFIGSSVFYAARAVMNFGEVLFVSGVTDRFWVRGIDLPAEVVETAPSFIAAWVGMSISGWLVGYLHRAHGPTMVIAFCVTLPLPAIASVAERLLATGTWAGPPLATIVVFLITSVYLPALIAGLCAVRPR